MDDLDRWLDQAWSDHADRPGEVAAGMAAEGAAGAAIALFDASLALTGGAAPGAGLAASGSLPVRALAQARAAFERLDPGDASWCRASLDRLASGGRR